MPVTYAGIKIEHNAVRENVGLFDVSHMGEFFVKGPQALDLLQYVTINDVSKMVDGQAQYNAMCYEDGGIVDDLLIYKMIVGLNLMPYKLVQMFSIKIRTNDFPWFFRIGISLV